MSVTSNEFSASSSDLLKHLASELCNISGISVSIKNIGRDLPSTDLETEGVCPEIVFPALAAHQEALLDKCYSIVSELEWRLKEGNNIEARG